MPDIVYALLMLVLGYGIGYNLNRLMQERNQAIQAPRSEPPVSRTPKK